MPFSGFLPSALRLLVLTSLATSPSLAAITNRTIDDTNGDSITSQRVIYRPTSGGIWNNMVCPLCAIRPDPVQAFSGTWTEATYFKQTKDPISATFSFTGTAIYVYFIVANNVGPGITTKTAANITLDNQPPQLFEHPPDMSRNDLQYNALAFSRTNLANTQHTLVISVSGLQEEIYINFDYAIYTHEDVEVTPIIQPTASPTTQKSVATSPSPSPTSQSSSNSVVAASLGPVTSAGSTPAASSPSSPSSTNSGTTAAGSQITNVDKNDSTVSAKSNTPVGAIAGGVVGGLVVIGLFIIGLILIKRRSREDDKYDNRNKINPYGSDAKEIPYPGHRRDASNATSVVPFPLASPSTVQLSDTTAASDGANPYGGMASISSGATGVQSSKGRMEDLRRARQEELEQRLQSTQQEMREILHEIDRHGAGVPPGRRPLPIPGQQGSQGSQSQATLATWGLGTTAGGEARYSAAPTDDDMTVDELKETLREMRAQVEYLHQQQQSAWAQGLSDEPPPGYSAITRAFSLRRSQS